MIEKSYLMIKPEFTDKNFICEVTSFIISNTDLKIVDMAYVKYQEDDAKLHYINKIDKTYYKELTDYLSSDIAFGIIVQGENAINKTCKIKQHFRDMYPKQFRNVKITNMKNVIHSSDSCKTAKNEIKIFETLKSKGTNV